MDSGKSVLYPPKLPAEYATWDGKYFLFLIILNFFRIEPESWFKGKYQVDEVVFNEGTLIKENLQKFNPEKLLLLVINLFFLYIFRKLLIPIVAIGWNLLNLKELKS